VASPYELAQPRRVDGSAAVVRAVEMVGGEAWARLEAYDTICSVGLWQRRGFLFRVTGSFCHVKKMFRVHRQRKRILVG
jgi:hypothetical protein